MDDDITQSFIDRSVPRTVGPYRVLKRIGAGGMGEVFLAHDDRLDRRIALKFLSASLRESPRHHDRFLREARTVAKLNHPNVVAVYDIGETGDRPFIAMEYIQGRSLRQIIDTEEILPERALRLAVDLCCGLKAAHDAGIVHRDLKPSNVIVDPSGRARLLDFALAATAEPGSLTQSGAVLGTVNYMSPEQARGEPVDPRSDLFSLGVVMYEMLTGVCPFERGYVPATVHAVVYEPCRPLSSYGRDLPAGVRAVVNTLLAKDAAQRYQTADAVQDHLDKLLDGRPISHPPKRPADTATCEDRLTVLYFRNLGAESDEYLSYSFTEDLIVALSRLKRYRVTPLRTSLRFKDSDFEISEIARSLCATVVLDGSVHRTDSSLCVSVQLSDASSESVLWAERYEGPIEQLPGIRQSVVHSVRDILEPGPGETVTPASPVVVNPLAYECYLRGKYAFEKKRDRTDVDTALALFRKAAEIDPTLLSVRSGIARVLIHKTEYDKAAGILRSTLEEARQRNDHLEQAAVLRLLSTIANHQSRYDDSITHLTEAVELSRRAGDLPGEAEANALLLSVYCRLSLYDKGKTVFERTMEIGHQLDDRSGMIHALRYMGWLHLQRAHRREAHQLFTSALRLSRQSQDVQAEAFVYNDIGMCYQGAAGDALEIAVDYQQKARRLLETLDDQNNLATIKGNIGSIYQAQGRFRLALESSEQAASTKKKTGDRASFVLYRANAASALIALGHYRRAIDAAEESETTAREIGSHVGQSWSMIIRGFALYMVNDVAAARQFLASGASIAESHSLVQQISDAYSTWGRIEYHERRYDDSRRLLQKGYDAARRFMNELAAAYCEAYLRAAEAHLSGRFDNFGLYDDLICRMEGTLAEASLKRLKAEMLLKFDATAAGRKAGRDLLSEALAQAKRIEFVPEIRWQTELMHSIGA